MMDLIKTENQKDAKFTPVPAVRQSSMRKEKNESRLALEILNTAQNDAEDRHIRTIGLTEPSQMNFADPGGFELNDSSVAFYDNQSLNYNFITKKIN